jgi:hypothetical protein
MDKFMLITFILCLLAAAVLLGFGITELVSPSVFTAQSVKISMWVMIVLGGILLIFSIISLVMGADLINVKELFGTRKVLTPQGEVSVVPPEHVEAAVHKFEQETGITVANAEASSVFSSSGSASSPKVVSAGSKSAKKVSSKKVKSPRGGR